MTAIPPDARALTIRQPWASLIALGVKSIETRSWRTSYQGPLVVHAATAYPMFLWPEVADKEADL